MKAEMESLYGSLVSRASKPMTRADFYFLADELVASVKDAHISLFYQGGSGRLPFIVDYISDGLVVTYSECRLRRCDKILSIGGRTPDDIMRCCYR